MFTKNDWQSVVNNTGSSPDPLNVSVLFIILHSIENSVKIKKMYGSFGNRLLLTAECYILAYKNLKHCK